MRAPRLVALLMAVCGLAAPASAQIRVAHWNICDFKGNTAAVTRVIQAMHADDRSGWAQPIDIITFNEVSSTTKSQLQTVVNNAAPTGVTYTLATFTINSESGGAQAMFFRSDRFSEITSGHVDISTGATRYTDRWLLQLSGYADAKARIYVYGSHLKASSGSTNESERLSGINAIRSNADALGAGVPVIYTGDYNFYTNAESGYIKLVSAGTAQAVDPYGTSNWMGSGGAVRHTQAPAVSPCCGLVGGGLDDRFDFIMPSVAANDGNGISMLASTMRAVGNDGAHYNTDINAGNNTYFPGDLTRSNALSDDLVIASDPIPQILEFTVPAKLSAAFASTLPTRAIKGAAVTLPVRIQNAATYVNTSGVDDMPYALTCSGAVSGSSTGTGALQPSSTSVNVTLNTATVGTATGTVTVTSSAEAVETPSVALPVSVQVINASSPSFGTTAPATTSTALTVECEPDSGLATMSTSLYNLGYTTSQSKLDVDSVTFSGASASRFSMPAGIGANLAAGARTLQFTFNSAGATPGEYATIATVRTSDEAVAGEQVRNVTVNLTVTVGTGLLGDLDGDGLVGAGDIAILLLDYCACAGCSSDLDGNGVVDNGDLSFLLLLFT
ncbi:MAG: endonuclease/exonuclease/phosphatase family protein [Planctomycetota bacterium]